MEEQQPKRLIRSFVKREGRLTPGQQRALDTLMPSYGLAVDRPFDWQGIYANDNPVCLEIGFGMGASLTEQAQNQPDTNFIGIEVHRPGVGACLIKLEEYELQNLRVVEHDAVEVLKNNIPDQSLDRIQIFFPDPWPKKRHHKRRLIQASFLASLQAKLVLGGVLHLATDWQDYAEHMLKVLTGNAHFANLSPQQDYLPRPETRPITKFEQRGERLGHGVWDLMFERVS